MRIAQFRALLTGAKAYWNGKDAGCIEDDDVLLGYTKALLADAWFAGAQDKLFAHRSVPLATAYYQDGALDAEKYEYDTPSLSKFFCTNVEKIPFFAWASEERMIEYLEWKSQQKKSSEVPIPQESGNFLTDAEVERLLSSVSCVSITEEILQKSIYD